MIEETFNFGPKLRASIVRREKKTHSSKMLFWFRIKNIYFKTFKYAYAINIYDLAVLASPNVPIYSLHNYVANCTMTVRL